MAKVKRSAITKFCIYDNILGIAIFFNFNQKIWHIVMTALPTVIFITRIHRYRIISIQPDTIYRALICIKNYRLII